MSILCKYSVYIENEDIDKIDILCDDMKIIFSIEKININLMFAEDRTILFQYELEILEDDFTRDNCYQYANYILGLITNYIRINNLVNIVSVHTIICEHMPRFNPPSLFAFYVLNKLEPSLHDISLCKFKYSIGIKFTENNTIHLILNRIYAMYKDFTNINIGSRIIGREKKQT
jgi:hypothetical protein